MKITYISAPGIRGAAVTPKREKEYKEKIKKYFVGVDTDFVYIEAKKNALDLFVAEAENHFKYIQVDATYQNRDKNNGIFIIRCGKENYAPRPAIITNAEMYAKWLTMQYFVGKIDYIYSRENRMTDLLWNYATKNNKKMNMIER